MKIKSFFIPAKYELNIISKFFIVLIIVFQAVLVSAQMPHYRVSFGKYEVTALLDGTVTLDAENILYNQQKGAATKLLKESFQKNPVEISINAFLVKTDSKLILIDAGAGEVFGEKESGKIAESLKSAGYEPSQITDILLTHIHGDHSGGLTVNGKPVFENAVIHVNKLEFDYWMSEVNKAKADAHSVGNNPKTFETAAKTLLPYIRAQKIKTFVSDSEALPGIKALLSSGHTPGHTVYVIEKEESKLVFWGDLTHIGTVQFVDPLMDDHFDVNLLQGKDRRVEFYKKAATEKYVIAASHISFPGFGHLKFEAGKYIWMPLPYSISGRIE